MKRLRFIWLVAVAIVALNGSGKAVFNFSTDFLNENNIFKEGKEEFKFIDAEITLEINTEDSYIFFKADAGKDSVMFDIDLSSVDIYYDTDISALVFYASIHEEFLAISKENQMIISTHMNEQFSDYGLTEIFSNTDPKKRADFDREYDRLMAFVKKTNLLK